MYSMKVFSCGLMCLSCTVAGGWLEQTQPQRSRVHPSYPHRVQDVRDGRGRLEIGAAVVVRPMPALLCSLPCEGDDEGAPRRVAVFIVGASGTLL